MKPCSVFCRAPWFLLSSHPWRPCPPPPVSMMWAALRGRQVATSLWLAHKPAAVVLVAMLVVWARQDHRARVQAAPAPRVAVRQHAATWHRGATACAPNSHLTCLTLRCHPWRCSHRHQHPPQTTPATARGAADMRCLAPGEAVMTRSTG